MSRDTKQQCNINGLSPVNPNQMASQDVVKLDESSDKEMQVHSTHQNIDPPEFQN